MLTEVIATTVGIAVFATLATLPVTSEEPALFCVSFESAVVSFVSCAVST